MRGARPVRLEGGGDGVPDACRYARIEARIAAVVLLVEDRENLRDLLARRLGQRFEVDAVGDAETAIALLDRDYAVVVSDVRLPGASGTDVLTAAKQRPQGPEVVLMTAHGTNASYMAIGSVPSNGGAPVTHS